MDEWWEFRLAIQLAPLNLGELFPYLWWFRTIWFWIPLFGTVWVNDYLSKNKTVLGIVGLPAALFTLSVTGNLLSLLTPAHPPCRFLKIQEVIPHGFYFCEGGGGLPEINSLVISGLLGYLLLFCSFPSRNWMIFISLVALFLSGISSVLLVQAFVSDVLSGWVLGILLTFVSQKLLSRFTHDIN